MDKIELIFNMYKERVAISKPFREEVIKKYKVSEEEARNLWIRIQNYQIKKFGGRLEKWTTYSQVSIDDKKRIRANAMARKTARKRGTQNKKLLDKYFNNTVGSFVV